MIDYDKLLEELREEKAACQYAYGEMVPAFYTQALRKAIEGIEECRGCAADAHTWAEKISVRFRDGRQPRPVKNSYMFCDTLDMCFFYGGPQHDIPYMTYAGYVTAGSPDITEDKLVEAFNKAGAVLRIMKRLAEEAGE